MLAEMKLIYWHVICCMIWAGDVLGTTNVIRVQAQPSQFDGRFYQPPAPIKLNRDAPVPAPPRLAQQQDYGGQPKPYLPPPVEYNKPYVPPSPVAPAYLQQPQVPYAPPNLSYQQPPPAPPGPYVPGPQPVPVPYAPNPPQIAQVPGPYIPVPPQQVPQAAGGGYKPKDYFGPPVTYVPAPVVPGNGGYGQQQGYGASLQAPTGCGTVSPTVFGYGGGAGGGNGGGYGGYGSGGSNGGYGFAGGCCGGNVDTAGDPCYRKTLNTIVVNAQPYERHSGASLDECKSYCAASQNQPTTAAATTNIFQCKSFVFDIENRVCDLFAHVGYLRPAKLVQCYGRDYYEATGNASCGTATSTLAPRTLSPCPRGQLTKYVQVPGYLSSGGSSSGTAPGTSIQSCVEICNAGNANGQAIQCQSFDFNNGQCTFYASSVPAQMMASGLTQSSSATHVDVLCLDSGVAEGCQGPFERRPQMILIGYAELVTDATDFNDCLKECLNSQAQYGFKCLSAEFYYKEQVNNCILNSETRISRPDLFQKEDEYAVDYFQMNCQGGSQGRSRFALLRSLGKTTTTTSRPKTTTTTEPPAPLNPDPFLIDPEVSAALTRLLKATTSAQPTDEIPRDESDEEAARLAVLTAATSSPAAAPSSSSDAEWSAWSDCDRKKDGKRIRYRECGARNRKECPFESEWCNVKGVDLEEKEEADGNGEDGGNKEAKIPESKSLFTIIKTPKGGLIQLKDNGSIKRKKYSV